jgi:hypothetical protein
MGIMHFVASRVLRLNPIGAAVQYARSFLRTGCQSAKTRKNADISQRTIEWLGNQPIETTFPLIACGIDPGKVIRFG